MCGTQGKLKYKCRCVGIGRRDRLKICYPQGCVGSSPTTGTRIQWLANPVKSRVCGLSFLLGALDSSPCTSAKSGFFDNGPPVLRQIWRSISVMDHRRIYPHDRVGRRHFGIEIQMSIDIRGRRNIAVTQPFLDFFQADSVCIQQTRAAMPLRYNKDKRKNPVFSRVSAFVVAYSIPFPTLIVNEKSVE